MISLPFRLLPAVLVTAALGPLPACAQQQLPTGATAPTRASTYADIADLVIASPLVIDAAIQSTAKIKGADAATVPPGITRFYVEADVLALVRGPGAIPPRVGYLLDVAPDADGRLPKLKKARVLLFARPVSGRPDQVQLVTPSAQLAWDPASAALVGRVVGEALSNEAPPVVTGIGNAFHVAGSLPGEGETQIFLTTADRRPVSLSILRRPGEQPRWAVALSEIVDDAAAPPRRDTLLWYRLACTLPPVLPESATTSLAEADAVVAREDYRFVINALGPCARSAAQPPAS